MRLYNYITVCITGLGGVLEILKTKLARVREEQLDCDETVM